MRCDFTFAIPPGRIASARSPARAPQTSFQVGKRFLSPAKARSRFVSDVFCDRTVRISSSRGSSRGFGSNGPWAFRSRR
jgi:hypothetical protein